MLTGTFKVTGGSAAAKEYTAVLTGADNLIINSGNKINTGAFTDLAVIGKEYTVIGECCGQEISINGIYSITGVWCDFYGNKNYLFVATKITSYDKV